MDLPPGPPPPARNYNPTEGVWNTKLWNALRGNSFLRKSARVLPIKIRSKIRNLVNNSVKKEISFSSKEKRRFLDKIEEGVFQMEEQYGVDISEWSVGT
ncbi:hypothetical protein GGP92_003072 [Salinibacter ruber]|nr:hypothetical protein [Salinibacter ruber]